MAPADLQIRLAAFSWLRDLRTTYGEVLPRPILARGFQWNETRVPLLGPQGIFKPQVLPQIPLSITTTPKGSYDDHFGTDGLLRYAYRGTDPSHHDNVGLREAMRQRAPLVYFHGVVPSKYLAAWPVFIVGDEPDRLRFRVALDDAIHASEGIAEIEDQRVLAEAATEGRRAYVTATLRRRLHQQTFRQRVLRAYREQCALCRLKHQELLDAAHIIGDTEEDGEPIVTNGLALCKLHHAAYDRNFLAVRPDYIVEVRADVLAEEDGPMLLHGLKGLHHQGIELPRSVEMRPDPERLARRYERFRLA